MRRRAQRSLEALETGLNLLSATLLFLLMFYVTAEVAMRYLFNAPLPGHLEATQLLIAPAV
ncbi:MAG: TRAP transporter small permease, partial [Candidatus Rokuibacteriota bacterium]